MFSEFSTFFQENVENVENVSEKDSKSEIGIWKTFPFVLLLMLNRAEKYHFSDSDSRETLVL